MRWLAFLLALVLAAPSSAQLVQTKGRSFIAPDGAVLQLKGINLGNWLMPEGYMFKFEKAKAPRQIYGAFERLLGRVGLIVIKKAFGIILLAIAVKLFAANITFLFKAAP